jgi:sugar phosphate isomerase/epimerase
MNHTITLFTKYWKNCSINELCDKIKELGFDSIEYPFRAGFQVNPDNYKEKTEEFVCALKNHGIVVDSVACELSEASFYFAGAVGARCLRIMLPISIDEDYMTAVKAWTDKINSYVPLCKKYNVKIAVQNHCGKYIYTTMELKNLLDGCDKEWVGASWDCAHSGLAGEMPEHAISLVMDRILMVNMVAAYYKREDLSGKAFYFPCFTTARYGNCDWRRVVRYLLHHDFEGVYCMHAEYGDIENTETNTILDRKYLDTVLEEEGYYKLL